MRNYKQMVRTLLAETARSTRINRGLTQEKMAEQLRITSRAYGDLERGKYCFSAIALLFLLQLLTEEEVAALFRKFREQIAALDRKQVA